jgi:hypothetical protein
LEVFWEGLLEVRPDEQYPQYQRISLDGGVKMVFHSAAETGSLKAETMFLWLSETPGKTPTEMPLLKPHHMAAQKNVVMDSSQLIGHVESLEAWFVDQTPVAAQPSPKNITQIAPGVPLALTYQQPGSASPRSASSPGPASKSQPFMLPPSTAESGAARQQFEVIGRCVQINLITQEHQQPVVSQLRIEDGVQLLESRTAKPDERPMAIRGDLLEAFDVDRSDATRIDVVGQPARFEARGLGLSGPAIHLNCGINRLWIDGNGRMDLPMPANPDAKVPANAPQGTAVVRWSRSMDFDGQTAKFCGDVTADIPQRRLHTETMDVQMQSPIRFSEPKMQQNPQVESVQCFGGVTLVSQEYDESQQIASKDHFVCPDLYYNVLTGAINGGGPGHLNSVRRGSGGIPGGPAFASKPVAAIPVSNVEAVPLQGLYVRFQKNISGNLQQKQMMFSGSVRASFAAVPSWETMLDTDNLATLGPNSMVLRSDTLSVRETQVPLRNAKSIEVVALGNAAVDGAAEDNTLFTAMGNRIAYDKFKELLSLEGSGNNYARMFRQVSPGSPREESSFQHFFYSRKTNQIIMSGVDALQINKAPGPSGF